ncbi:Transposon TX1 uncharacterized 149 kDa protein ORF 2 [Takifugu flavidus]|uniref:Transposon TX1 uncharacterized 149 kDa protein ORF 2 n=1 Tax=Takifugu flavidus TaxID=433684 RepID=A0A5C6MG59_9TELE|nr:Transposon TX1 uncharacterized 149 kDa protein ORF 2 [Takifugu flavidus]
MKDKGGKTGRLEETVADTDTSDCESMSDGSELSGTTPDGQDFDLYPPGLFKKFLTQTKGMKGLDLGTYFPDRLCFIRDCGIEADWEKEWEGQVLLSHNTTLSGGVGLLFSRGFTPSSLEVEHVWWDRGKVEMQLLCQQYTLNATQDTRRSIKDLEMEIVELEAIGSSTGDRGCIETLQSKKMALASLLDILFNRLSAARVNWQKSEALAVGRWTNGLPVLPQDLAWRRDGLKYLGVFIGDEETEKKNWLDTLEKVDGKIQKWKWLLPRMSYRGRTLVLNNLVASVLWHRLSCMEPPSGLLGQLQTRVLAFFWDGMLWVQQGVLYLPREEGGQGLIHLASRTAAFRIQFVQRFLTGPADLMWRDVARCVFRRVSNLWLDDALFLTDFKFAKLNGLPPFYQSVVKAWALFKVEKRTSSESLYWLLREPTVHGARLDVSAEAPPRLTAALWRTRTLLLQHVVAVAGPDLTGAEAVGSLLGIRSTQAAEGVLRLWRNRLSTIERRILEDYGQGTEPDSEDPFPEIRLVAHLRNLDGPLLRPAKTFSLVAVDKKTLYNDCVRVLNRRGLSNRNTSVWADRLGGDGARPCWRVLYKPPLKKRTGDLQWRILHGAVTLNALLSRMNAAVSDQCPFCSGRETVFHTYSECERLTVLFNVMKGVFNGFKETFSIRTFIFGAGYNSKAACNKWQLLNFICGEAKMAIYVSRKNKISKTGDSEAASVWRCNVRCRLTLEFGFYKMMNDLGKFQDIWCHKNVLCTVTEDLLHFAHPLVG